MQLFDEPLMRCFWRAFRGVSTKLAAFNESHYAADKADKEDMFWGPGSLDSASQTNCVAVKASRGSKPSWYSRVRGNASWVVSSRNMAIMVHYGLRKLDWMPVNVMRAENEFQMGMRR